MLVLWLAAGVLAKAGESPPQPPVIDTGATSGSGKRIVPWWRGYVPVRLTQKRKQELVEEVIETVAPEPGERVTQAEIARLDAIASAFDTLVIDSQSRRAALIREITERVNAQIEAAEQDDEEAFFLLH
jgi:hypothetical protein